MTSQAETTCSLQRAITAPESCLHCGSSLAFLPAQSFCCRGCETVYRLLEQRGLTRYYDLRSNQRRGALQGPSLFRNPDEKYDYLDDADFIANYTTPDGLEMRFYLEGVHCAACVWLTEKLPDFVSEVESLRLNLGDGVATVRLKKAGGFSGAAKELARLGYRPHPVRSDESDALRQRENRRHLVQLAIAAAATGNIMLLAIALYAGATARMAQMFSWVSFLLYLPVFFYSALPFYRSAWSALHHRQVSIDIPIVFGLWVGTAVSIYNLLVGSDQIYFDSLSALVFLLLSTRYLLRKVNERSLNARKWVYFLAPSKARREHSNGRVVEEIKTDLLKAGDVIQVFQGEAFPVDGEVISGESFVNRAVLSGESDPVAVAPGERVHAGTQNTQAPLRVRVVSSGAETRLGKLLTAMQDGLSRQAPIVAFVDRVGQVFVVAVLVFTALAFIAGLGVGVHEAFNRALAAAIVVCPCTFALATPLAMSLAISRAARSGILVKGADIIERLSQVNVVFFDKTGTLTHGDLEVLSWSPLEPEATKILIALEKRSAHPVAKAVQRHFIHSSGTQIEELPFVDYVETSGQGVNATLDGHRYELRRFRNECAGSFGGAILSSIALYRDGVLVGRLDVGDRVRSDAKSSIRQLKTQGLQVALLSGDSEAPASAVGRALEISAENIFAERTPEEKADKIRATARSLMVGDGANDAVALASAHASIAVQGGMEMSMQAAGVYSSKPGVSVVPDLITLSRETMKVIRRNLVFAVIYNIVGIGAAVTGHLDPLFAAVLMPLSALTVFLSTIAGTSALRRVFTEGKS